MEDNENEEILRGMMSWTSSRMPLIKLKDQYSIMRRLGCGTYGSVLLAEHKLQGRDRYTVTELLKGACLKHHKVTYGSLSDTEPGNIMALKLMKKKSTRKENFLMEYCVSLCLGSHPNVIKTLPVAFETSRYFAFAMELATSGDLHSIIVPQVGIPEIMVKRCAMQLAEALDFMHSKALVHRDVKLDNILLFDEDCHYIKLADFGLTRLEGFNISPLRGTVPYSPPELCTLEENDTLELDSSLDVWSFGVLLFCISTGYFPWDTALCKDKLYEQFVLWQTTGNYQKIPSPWRQFTWRALDMFQKLLAVNAMKRCPAIEVQKYLSDPWKMNSVNDNSNLQDN